MSCKNIPNPYRGIFEHKMVNRDSTILSFARNLCQQLCSLPHWATSRTKQNPFMNTIIGTKGSGKTTFGCCFLQTLLESPQLVSELRESLKACSINPCFVDLLLYLYLSGRWLGVELPTYDEMQCSAEDYFLDYVVEFFGIKREGHESQNRQFIPSLRALLSCVETKDVNHELCCFKSDSDALDFYKEYAEIASTSLPFLFFCDEVSSSKLDSEPQSKSDENNEEGLDMIRDFFPVFKQIVRESVALVYTAGLYRRYIENRLVNSKFDVVSYRLPAIVDLNHLKQFLDNDNKLKQLGFDEFEALNCLIRCAGNPRLIVNVINNYKKTSTWKLSVSSSAINSGPIFQALAIAAVPLLLSCSDDGSKADVLSLPSGFKSLDILELESNLMLSPLVTSPPTHLRQDDHKFEATRYHCILNTFNFGDTMLQNSCLTGNICRNFQKLIGDQLTLFVNRRSAQNYSAFVGNNAEDLVIYLLLMRNNLVRNYLQLSNDKYECRGLPLVYLFGPSHTETLPDDATWINRNYSIELYPLLNFQQLQSAVKPNSRNQQPTFNIDAHRGHVCKNVEKAQGPDIVLIPMNGNVLIGVDCKVRMKEIDEFAVEEFAKQFVQSLACHPPVPVLFSIRSVNSATEVYQIKQQLTDSVYEKAFQNLKQKDSDAFLDNSFQELLQRVEIETGVRPIHELFGNQFFGPILGAVLKTYYKLKPDEPQATNAKCSLL
ncbi:hypothetical protein P9112_009372 [Eukaryota sp. TZLM1-RC]